MKVENKQMAVLLFTCRYRNPLSQTGAHPTGVPLSGGDPGTQHAGRHGAVALLTLGPTHDGNLCFLQD